MDIPEFILYGPGPSTYKNDILKCILSYKTAERARYSLQTNDFLLHWWRIQKGEKNVWLFIKGNEKIDIIL